MKLSYHEIERLMAAHEYTQRVLANAMGIHQPVLCQLLARIRNGGDVRPVTAGKLARALSCDVEQIEAQA